MSPLTVLYLVLPLPLAFIINEAEVFISHRRIYQSAKTAMPRRCRKLFERPGCTDAPGTRSFIRAVMTELAVVLAATAMVLIQMPYSTVIWSVVFLGFSLRLVLNIVQSFTVGGYVPGLITSVVLLPYAALGCHAVYLANSVVALLLYGLTAFLLVLLSMRQWY